MTFSLLVYLSLAQVFLGRKKDNSPDSKALARVAVLHPAEVAVFVWCDGLF